MVGLEVGGRVDTVGVVCVWEVEGAWLISVVVAVCACCVVDCVSDVCGACVVLYMYVCLGVSCTVCDVLGFGDGVWVGMFLW